MISEPTLTLIKSFTMADSDGLDIDDQWLYGDAPEIPGINPEAPPGLQDSNNQQDTKKGDEDQPDGVPSDVQKMEPLEDGKEPGEMDTDDAPGETSEAAEDGEIEKMNGEGSDKDDSEEEDSDDDNIKVFIGDAGNVTMDDKKTYASGQSSSLNVKRGGLITVTDRNKQSGKFNVEEFEQMGNINGMPVADYNLDNLEEKPWRKPGADITDYFNYGFNEDTWKAYCERQKRLRMNESGVGIIPLNSIGMPRGPIPNVVNDNSKYGGTFGTLRKAGPPPGRRMMGSIDVIGNNNVLKVDMPKENVIQVMTADRREYSRKPTGFPDMSMPPPVGAPHPAIVPVGPPPPDPFDQFQPEFGFNPEPEPFYGGYEPTQDVQWGVSEPPSNSTPVGPPGWPGAPPAEIVAAPPPNQQDGSIKTLVGGPPPPGGVVGIPIVIDPGGIAGSVPVPIPIVVPAPLGSNSSADRHGVLDTPPPASSRGGGDSNSPPPPGRRGGSSEPSRGRSEKRDRNERDRESSRRESRRDRSRSRSRRHKSRSRSPSHRSHRKKKSRRHDDSD